MTEKKCKNKNVTLISLIILIIIIANGVVCYFIRPEIVNQTEGEKISKLYEDLKEKEGYTFEAEADKDNRIFFVKQSNQAYLEEITNGTQIKTIVKDGNTYLIKDDEKVYYTYKNNNTNLSKVEEALQQSIDSEYEVGKEKINDKTYTYVEISKLTDFAILYTTATRQVKTRFYFDGDKLAYIKTIADKNEELLKITIFDNVENKLFEIPVDYQGK